MYNILKHSRLHNTKGSDTMSLSGGQLAGGNTTTKRADKDYYATDPQAVDKIMKRLSLIGAIYDRRLESILEPCVGEGHIIEGLKPYIYDSSHITTVDIVDRNYPNIILTDYTQWKTDKKFTFIISNPPYSCAKEFIYKSMELLEPHGLLLFYLKLQFLEGKGRKELFDKYPPKYIYVMRNRTPTWKNGSPVNPDTGKKWAETICFAWFVWEKNIKTEPVIRWLD